MTQLNADRLADLDPVEFVRAIKNAPSSDLRATMSGGQRGLILDAVFARLVALFRPDRAGSTSAVIHWHIAGRPDGGTDDYQLAIADQRCDVSRSLDREARLAVTLSGVDFLKLLCGRANPAMMFMTGKLRARGDLGLATSVVGLFDLPRT